MPTPQEKSLLVLQEERLFAAALAGRVIDKPQLSIWMILIPIIFVFFFYRFQRYVAGKKNFAGNYLLFINRLDQAEKALNRALVEQLRATTNAVDNTVGAIEQASEQLRREKAAAVFGK